MVKRLFIGLCIVGLMFAYLGYVLIASIRWVVTGKPVDMLWIDKKWDNLERKYKL